MPQSRTLYRITVVNPKTESVVATVVVVAIDTAQALLKADLPVDVRQAPGKFDFLWETVGSVRPERETQKVEVVGTTTP